MDSIDFAQQENSDFIAYCINKNANRKIIEFEQIKNTKGKVICANCGEKIPVARLKAIPNTVYCKDCMEEFEEADNF